MYIKIKIACDQNKLKFGRALIGLALIGFSTNSSLFNIFLITLITNQCLN